MFFFSSRRRHTRWPRDWSSDVCSSDLTAIQKFHMMVLEQKFLAEAEHCIAHLTSADSLKSNRGLVYGWNPYQGNRKRNERSEERRVGKERRTRRAEEKRKEKEKQ